MSRYVSLTLEGIVEAELKRGVLDVLIMKLLEEHESYGYELVTRLDSLGGGFLTIKEGTLYPLLYRLEEKGYVVPRWEPPTRGVPRKYYRLTDAGRVELAQQSEYWRHFSRAVSTILTRGAHP